jgi:hypothetical protein
MKYKWQVYRAIEKISVPRALYYLCNVAIRGLVKSRL